MSAAFGPFAASFLSPATGFVLGGVGCRFGVNGAQRLCKPVVVATADGGRDWRGVSSPPTTLAPVGGLGMAGPAVKAITFADARDGWLFGPGLWATHDGGNHWARVAMKAQVNGVVASGGWVYATTVSLVGGFSLFRSPLGREDWQPVGSLAATTSPPVALLAAFGRAAWVGVLARNPKPTSVPELWRTAEGAHWQLIGNPCASASQTLLSVTATTATDLAMLCSGSTHEQIVTSSDGGIHTRQIAPTPTGSYFGVVAAPLGQSKIVVLASPSDVVLPANLLAGVHSVLDRTIDGGRSWTSTTYGDRGIGWADLEFVSPTVAWVVHGFPGASNDQLMQTTDAGATFKPVPF